MTLGKFCYLGMPVASHRRMSRVRIIVLLGICLVAASALTAEAQVQAPPPERLCDTQFEDCREPILNLIRNEQVEIDVAFWYMQDSRYVTELAKRFSAGVPIRVLVDQRANPKYKFNATMIQGLINAGIPIREKFAGPDIMHFKFMVFHGQNMVNFSKANFDPFEYVPDTPNVNYDDEAVFFTNDDRITNSFRRRFDDRWIDTTEFKDTANITAPLARGYPLYPIDPAMNFSPLEDYGARLVARMAKETQGIDAIVFRAYDDRETNAMVGAVNRGLPVRLITEPTEYRNPDRLLDSVHVDRMYMGGVQIKIRNHAGLTHEAAVVLRGLGEAVFGSSNWTVGSATQSDEHNFFYTPAFNKPWFFQWFAEQFDRKWNDTTNYIPFTPLPPGTPAYSSPGNGVSGQGTSVTLTWDGGIWAHFYDIYFGTTSNPPLLAGNLQLGSFQPGVIETYTVNSLQPGTTYYWRIVGKTYAQAATSGPVWSFTTSGSAPGGGGGSTPFRGTPAAVPGVIQFENFDDGGQFVAYNDTTAGNSLGQYRATDVDIEATADSGGGFSLGKTRAGEWLNYTVSVSTTATYQLDLRVANMGTGASLHVEVDGVDRTGPIAIPDTGGWQTWQTITKTGVPLTAGTRVLRVVLDTVSSAGGAGNLNWFQLSTSATPPPPPPDPGNTPFGGTAATIPGVVEFENFDNGGQSVAYSDTTSGNSGGVYRSTDVDLEATTDAGGGYDVMKTRAGEWLKYTVNVTASGTYPLVVRVANMGTGARFHVEVDGIDKTGPVAMPDTGGWQIWQSISAGSLTLTAGDHVIRFVLDTVATSGGVGNYNWFQLGNLE